MRIAVSGTHGIGKTTLIDDFIKKYPEYKSVTEAYYQLQDEKINELYIEPSLDSFIDQLDCSIEQLDRYKEEQNIIFDRSPIDYIAYAMYIANQESIDIIDTDISERLIQVKEALTNLDLILFLPITKDHLVEYTEEDSSFRSEVDNNFKEIYRDDRHYLFLNYNQPKIIEIYGDRLTRLKKVRFICDL